MRPCCKDDSGRDGRGTHDVQDRCSGTLLDQLGHALLVRCQLRGHFIDSSGGHQSRTALDEPRKVPMPSITHKLAIAPPVRRPTQAKAREMPAPVVGSCSHATCRLVSFDDGVSVGPGVAVHTDDKRAGLCNGTQCRHPPSFQMIQDRSHHDRHWTWEEVTSRQHSDEPQPRRLGKLPIKPPTWVRSTPAAPSSADKSGKGHPQGANCFSSHAPSRTTGINTAS